MYYSEHKTL